MRKGHSKAATFNAFSCCKKQNYKIFVNGKLPVNMVHDKFAGNLKIG